ncbi:MAG: zinc ribbon domain-containing protein [Janthinobacterium lividum]
MLLDDTNQRPDMGDGGEELKMIPLWSIVVSLLVFSAVQVLSFWGHQGPPPPHRGNPVMHVIGSYSWGAALASYVLLIGYISRDVKRRNMRPALWMLIVLVMPGGIGAIVYFLLRQPMMSRCPSCRTEVASSFHFCPQCQFQMSPVCGQCFRGVHITDVYCVQCGHDLTNDDVPARLRSYSD